ncbi:MAG: hypothetical protein ACYDDF_01785 [Thermoplasmatota archaeon]
MPSAAHDMRTNMLRLRALRILILTTLIGAPFVGAFAHAQASGGSYRVAITNVTADYTSESWKDEQPVLGTVGKSTPLPVLPVGYTGVYQNPYFGSPHFAPGVANAWGYHLNLTLELRSSNNATIANPDQGLYVNASLILPSGTIPSKIAKLSSTQFLATFDLDGGEPGKNWPDFASGLATLQVDVYNAIPTAQANKVASQTFTVRASNGAAVNFDALTFPWNGLPVYTDLGCLTLLHASLVKPSATIPVTFSFGVPNAAVHVILVDAYSQVTIASTTTDSAGDVSVSVQPAKVLGSATGGLVLLEAHLLGDPATLTVGDSVIAIPVAGHTTTISGIIDDQPVPGAPPTTIRATVRDPDAGATGGPKYGYLDAVSGTTLLEQVPFQPVEPGSNNTGQEYARYSAMAVISHKLASYQLYTFQFDAPNQLYSFALATRGFMVEAPAVSVGQGATTTIPINVINLDANGDVNPDPDLGITAQLLVKGLPGGKPWIGNVSVGQGTNQTVNVPISTGQAGAFTVVVNATASELQLVTATVASIAAPESPLDSFLHRLTPAPPEALVVLVIAAAALALRRRT